MKNANIRVKAKFDTDFCASFRDEARRRVSGSVSLYVRLPPETNKTGMDSFVFCVSRAESEINNVDRAQSLLACHIIRMNKMQA